MDKTELFEQQRTNDEVIRMIEDMESGEESDEIDKN